MNESGHIEGGTIRIASIFENTELSVIRITEDKLELALIAHLGKVETKNRWQIPLGILLALVPAILTSEFKTVAGVDKSVWQALFMMISAGAILWLIFTAKQAFTTASVKDLIKIIKNSAPV